MTLAEFETYNLAMDLGERVWKIVERWDYFVKGTVGKQLVSAADSIAANLSEGYGRYHYKESKNFGYYARGSLYETKTWIKKAANRKLIDSDDSCYLERDLDKIAIKLNKYIKSIGTNSKNNGQ